MICKRIGARAGWVQRVGLGRDRVVARSVKRVARRLEWNGGARD